MMITAGPRWAWALSPVHRGQSPWEEREGTTAPRHPAIPPRHTTARHNRARRAQVRAIYADLLSGDSLLLKAIRDMYAALGARDDATHVPDWRVVLHHWATAVRAGYTMRATQADRDTFREHAWLYVKTKSSIRAGITVWYDWQFYSALPSLFDHWGSLMMISQEGMEAAQKRQNMLLRLGNGFANVGRIPIRILRVGREAVKAYLRDRRAKMKSPEEWLYQKNLTTFASANENVLHRVVAHREEGRTMDWKTEWSPERKNFWAISTIYRKLLARTRFNVWYFTRPGGAAEVTEPSLRRDRLRTDSAGRLRRPRPFPAQRTVVFHRKETPIRPDLVGHNFKIRVYDIRRETLASEIAAYYAPVPCESEPTFGDRDPDTQRKDIQTQRKARWKKRERSALWVESPYTVTDDV